MAHDTVLVTGGTGNIGSAFVGILAADARAPRVRVASRDHRSAGAAVVRALNPETVTPVSFDVDRPDTMRAALEGVNKVFVITPFVPDMAAWHDKVAAAAKAACSVEYVVKSSVTGARAPTADPPPGAVPLGHWKGEEAFRSWVPTTAIRPNIFMQHFLTVPGLYEAGADRFYLPTDRIGERLVARRARHRGRGGCSRPRVAGRPQAVRRRVLGAQRPARTHGCRNGRHPVARRPAHH